MHRASGIGGGHGFATGVVPVGLALIGFALTGVDSTAAFQRLAGLSFWFLRRCISGYHVRYIRRNYDRSQNSQQATHRSFRAGVFCLHSIGTLQLTQFLLSWSVS